MKNTNNFVIYAVFIIYILINQASACNIPVYRYALQFWPADDYHIVVNPGDAPSEEAKSALELLTKFEETDRFVNISLRIIQNKPEIATEEQITVYLPIDYQLQMPIYSGPLTVSAVNLIIDSPARQEIAKRLITQDAAVWILLESGDKDKDDQAESILKKQLDILQNELKTPDQSDGPVEDDPYAMAGPVDELPERALAFSIIRLKRDDPKEDFLVKSLLNTEPDLTEYAEPITFPVFGRGRALWALVGKGINEDMIYESLAFLAGACSCQVKAQNPGIDLLINTDWSKILDDLDPVDFEQPLVGMTTLTQAIPDEKPQTDSQLQELPPLTDSPESTTAIQAPSITDVQTETAGPITRNLYLTVAILIGAIAIITAVILSRKTA